MKYLRDHWDLLSYRILSEARAENRQLYIGFSWWVLEPLAYITVLYLVFGVIMERGGPGFIGFLLVGFVFWRWMDSTVKKTAQSFLGARGIITQVNLPHWLFPLSEVLSAALSFCVVLALLIIFCIFYSGQAGWAYLALPPLLALNLLFIFSLGLMFACIIPHFPDARKIIDNVFQLLFFASGIFFDVRQLNENIAEWLLYNPFAAFLLCYREIMLSGTVPSAQLLYSPLVATAGLLIVASFLYRRLHSRRPKALLR
ncbi:MAG: ABC transporter permease [Gammaproteobacteria bacterium]|nr:ABC transporter permease [Gammaproteobacteria bacterium]